MSENNPNEPDNRHIPDELIDAVQEVPGEDMLVELDGSASGGDKVDILRRWISEPEDYRAETVLTPRQVYAMVMLRNIGDIYDEIDDSFDLFLEHIIEDIERYALSIEGQGVHLEANVLRSAFGDAATMEPEERESMMLNLLSDTGGEDNE